MQESKAKEEELQRSRRTEDELKRKIAWLEGNVVQNFQRVEGEARSLRGQLESCMAEKGSRSDVAQRLEAESSKLRAELAHAEKHAAELHMQLAQLRAEMAAKENDWRNR